MKLRGYDLSFRLILGLENTALAKPSRTLRDYKVAE